MLNRILTGVFVLPVLLVLLPGSSFAEKTTKHGAPVSAEFSIQEKTATLELRFSTPVTGAYVQFHGVQGVTNVTPPIQQIGSVPAGSQSPILIGFALADDPGRDPQLVATVFVYVGSRRQSRVFSATVPQPGDATPGIRGAGSSDSAIQTDHKGRPIHVLPAD